MELQYDAPPTCARFMRSTALIRIIAGPVGSGKTTACIWELFRRACEQHKGPDGIRRTRFAIVRQTLSQLKQTVLKDILYWMKGIADYRVSENTIYIRVGDVQSEWVLIPLEDPEDQKRLLSSQLTGAWMSECIEIDAGLVGPIFGRCGRYPSAADGGATWYGVIGDTNMPSIGSEWHRLMELETPSTWQRWIQPGGMEDDAENLEWLLQNPETLKLPPDDPVRRARGRVYYKNLLEGHGEDWVKRYVHAQYGDDPSGSAVFRQSFKLSFHVVDEVMPVHGHPLIVGQDFGRDPCSIITQLDHKGRLLILQEVVAEDIGLELHIQRALRPALYDERYMGRPVAVVGDPAGRDRSTIYEETTFDVMKRMGFMAFPASTNNVDARLRAVEAFFERQADGGPAIIIDKARCPRLIRALSGGYRFARMRSGQLKPAPEKNEFSHIADALQYACLAAHGGMVGMISAHLRRPSRAHLRQRVSSAAWT